MARSPYSRLGDRINGSSCAHCTSSPCRDDDCSPCSRAAVVFDLLLQEARSLFQLRIARHNSGVGKNFSGNLTAKVLSLAVNGSVTNATLTAKTTLTSLTVKGSYVNTNLTAKSISKASLGTIKTHNSGTPFTLKALSIASLSAKLDTGKPLALSGVNSTPKLTPQLTKAGNLNDLKIQIA